MRRGAEKWVLSHLGGPTIWNLISVFVFLRPVGLLYNLIFSLLLSFGYLVHESSWNTNFINSCQWPRKYMKLLLPRRPDHVCVSSPTSSLNAVLAEHIRQELLHLFLGRNWVWENVWDQKVLSWSERDSWSWGPERQLGGWVGLKPWQAKTGSEASVVAAARPLKKQNRSRE